jgi:hypothetical protein
MKNKLIFIFILFTGCPAYAGFQVGISTNYLNINDDYQHTNSFSKPSISYGYNYIYKPFVITATTNRLLNQASEQQVSKNGLTFTNKTKITADTFMIGYANRLSPFVFLTNAGVEKILYNNERFVGKTKKHSLLFGGGINYSYDKNLIFSTAIIAPNKEQDLEYGLNFSIIYTL